MTGASVVAPARAADVVSSNIVGYYKLNLANGYTQIGVQLQNVGDDAGTIGLNDLSFNGLTGYDWDAGTPGDSITIWDSASQSYAATYYWTATDPFELGIGSNVWFDESALAKADVEFTTGDSIFVKTATAEATATIAGEVASADSVESKTLVAGYTQFSNPYPVAIDINSIQFTGLSGYDWDAGVAGDSLTIWDSTSQSYAATYYWTASDPFELGIGSNVWFDESALAKANVTIPVGGSIFVFSKNGGTATFTAP